MWNIREQDLYLEEYTYWLHTMEYCPIQIAICRVLIFTCCNLNLDMGSRGDPIATSRKLC